MFVSQLWNKHMIFDFEEDIKPKEKSDINCRTFKTDEECTS